jgi:hypothetical protein
MVLVVTSATTKNHRTTWLSERDTSTVPVLIVVRVAYAGTLPSRETRFDDVYFHSQ